MKRELVVVAAIEADASVVQVCSGVERDRMYHGIARKHYDGHDEATTTEGQETLSKRNGCMHASVSGHGYTCTATHLVHGYTGGYTAYR